jgi:hypothetical protein
MLSPRMPSLTPKRLAKLKFGTKRKDNQQKERKQNGIQENI